ncbi:AraC family transcriptional regulator [Pseudoduganella umbonata]|uniref:AraC-like DNA-binding protein n=1 Tax=Pseudoduganella umbonata TaxID=864828 RepID=A0A4P8HMF9_9BURK|nr:helix-turn-helix domain-containing protein [Pseudoduganella umbonata]MBB3220215.1 AraC-like DNA-binding protein [Pseudoduganella umbonata]QCP10196.1 helix-turn-helix transcriptional regulator [Pseudoduganella umbonata]
MREHAGNDLPKGILDPHAMPRRFGLRRYPPPAVLAPFVDYLWIVEWNLEGAPAQVQRVLPYPHAHLVFEAGAGALHGVVRGAFDKTLSGRGRALGVRLRAGGLRPWWQGTAASLTGKVLPLEQVFGTDAGAAARQVQGGGDDDAMMAPVLALLAPAAAAARPDPRAALAQRALDAAAAPQGPVSVAMLAAVAGVPERGLQRLFQEHVGVPPKWVVQRYRLQEAAALLAAPACPDLAALAQQLGFFDQAHLTRAFTALVGRAPQAYRRSQLAGAG